MHPILEQLKTAASEATPGPWMWDGNPSNYDPENEAPWLINKDSSVIRGELEVPKPEDARFISLANPLVVGKLVECLQEALFTIKEAEATAFHPASADGFSRMHKQIMDKLASIPTQKEQ